MTTYEEVSLGLLSSIARGISLQMMQADLLTPSVAVSEAERSEALKKFRAAREAWQKGLTRFAALAHQSDPDRYE
jgi:hypothetical protein